MPRFVVFVRSTADSEGGVIPSTELLEEMSHYNNRLIEAGVLQGAEGLLASSRDCCRIFFHKSHVRTIRSGPFPSKELVSGLWILRVKDEEEAIDWAKRCPMPEGAVLEVRRASEMGDFGEAVTPELRNMEEEMRARVEILAKGE